MSRLNGHSSPGGRFVDIGKDVYISPSQNSGVVDCKTNNPTVILIFGWMGAKLPHLHKYTQVYEKRYPDATQILVRCSPSFFWGSERSSEASLAPVVKTLEGLGCIMPTNSVSNKKYTHMGPIPPSLANHRILVHSFSNGGAMELTTLGRILSNRSVNSHFPSAIIIDSAPGSPSVQHGIRAFSSAIKSRLGRFIVALAIYIFSGYSYVLYALFGRKHVLARLRDALLNPQVLPWVSADTPRLYLFSREDVMVQWDRVKAHTEEAQVHGINVRTELFEKSKHVAHVKEDPERYWDAIWRVWDDAC